MAKKLSSLFLECVVAPKFTKDAREVLARKKNLRLMEVGSFPRGTSYRVRSIWGGVLLQESDSLSSDSSSWVWHGARAEGRVLEDLVFAEKVCGLLKSNAIAIVGGGQTLGLGMGQVNRVDAVAHALGRWQLHHSHQMEVVLASDAFFPFPDSIDLIAKQGIRWILQPGGSIQDQSVIERAAQHNISMVMTGKRHFRH